ncbi:MAG: ECF transporter S component [Ruminococcaceae bacterium]|nr:ECF transporter S component [Oscillospiraceae bacterium]
MKTKKIVTTAMLIAVAAVLSIFQPFQLPFGGGITIASMMPIIIIAYCYGTKWGLYSAFIFSLVQLLMGMKTVTAFFMPGDEQMAFGKAICVCLLDYIVAYTVLGFGGIFKNKLKQGRHGVAICLGTIVALLLRYITHVVSGAIFFGAWADWFFGQEGFYLGAKILETFSGGGLACIYSIIYNGTYMIPEIIITAVITPIVYKALVSAQLVDQNM